ncbi:thiamine ABC transporter substrate-binding protein [Fusobacterium necrophorum subsp. funduliforme]
MKKIIAGSLLLLSSGVFAEEIVVYGPSTSKWIGKKYGPVFEKMTGDTIKYVSLDGVVQRLTLEKINPKADIVVGLTPVDIEVAKKHGVIQKYKPQNVEKIRKEIQYDKEYYAVPYDYGMLAINYDKTKIKNPPKNLEELGKMKKQLLIENPNTSNTGAEILQWSLALYGKNWKKFWTTIQPAIYNVEPGWEEAFAKFTAGEAPMMVGYATSDIWFAQDDSQKDKYASFYLEDGNYQYVESAALVAKKEVKAGAKKFMEAVLGEEFQTMTAAKNYMFPVTAVTLGKEFDSVPRTEKKVQFMENKEVVEHLANYKKEVVQILKK